MAELTRIARHGGTVLAGQLAVIAFGVTDTLVAGRYADTALAALSVGSAVYISVYVGLIGVLQATLPTWAELRGAGATTQLGRSVRQSLYLCLLAVLAGMAVLLGPGPLLRGTEVPPALHDDVYRYLGVLAVALLPALLFRLYASLNQALGRPLLVTWLQIGGLACKIPLSIWFAFGGAGLPAQGVVGCALATLVVHCGMVLVALWMLRTRPIYQPYALWRWPEAPDWRQIGAFARIGIPGGLAIVVEVTSFTLMALFIARLGAVASAGHQIAASLASVLYMVPLSVGIATSARVSYWIGAGDPVQVRSAIQAGFVLVACTAITFSAILFIASDAIAGLYTRTPDVAQMAATLLRWVALYHLADAVQALCVFVLRCYRVTVAPLAIYCVLLWGLGLAGGYLLVYHGVGSLPAMADPAAFWMASSVALVLTAVAFVLLLRYTVAARSA
ncbi:MAG TPA: MATE family efflux transporter [Burkholderiaceae bacterium]